MGIEREVTEGIRRQIRLIPPDIKFLDMLADMHTFFAEHTGKEPTKLIMGKIQWCDLTRELDNMRMIFMPQNGFAGMLLGMNIIIEGNDKLEVTI